jgi:hypothetical protein
MAQLINISIDLTKVSKSSIKEVKKSNGEIAKYLNLSVSVNDEKDKYDNDCSVSLAQSKEERESKQPKVFLGNGKIVWTGTAKAIAKPSGMGLTNDELNDLPF